jgi:hypothetical protein
VPRNWRLAGSATGLLSSDGHLHKEKRVASKIGPWFGNTWWGKRHFKINVSLVIALLLFLLWKSFF